MTEPHDSFVDSLRVAAFTLGSLEEERDTEFLRLVATGTNTWTAQRMVDAEFGPRIRLATAEYEIALARLRRA